MNPEVVDSGPVRVLSGLTEDSGIYQGEPDKGVRVQLGQ